MSFFDEGTRRAVRALERQDRRRKRAVAVLTVVVIDTPLALVAALLVGAAGAPAWGKAATALIIMFSRV